MKRFLCRMLAFLLTLLACSFDWTAYADGYGDDLSCSHIDAAESSRSTAFSVHEMNDRKPLPDAEDMPTVAEGEIVFWGSAPAQGADEISLRFILSADRKTIHHLRISATNPSSKSSKSSARLSKCSLSTDASKEVNFPGTVDVLTFGKCEILNLTFEDEESAHARVHFAFSQPSVGSSSGIEVDLPEVDILLEAVDASATGSDDKTAVASTPVPTPTPTATPAPTATPTAKPTATATVSPTPAGTEKPAKTSTPATKFQQSDLKNWNDDAIREAYGVNGLAHFTPKDPQPMYYIVSAKTVIDPVTGKESEGGYNKDYTRHKPISTETLLKVSGRLSAGGLTLTSDPDKATFVLILSFNYKDSVGNFRFKDGSTVKQYHPLLTATLKNMITGKSIKTTKKTYATYANERVYTSMLNAAKGKQLYGGAPSLSSSDFKGYWEFVNDGAPTESASAPAPTAAPTAKPKPTAAPTAEPTPTATPTPVNDQPEGTIRGTVISSALVLHEQPLVNGTVLGKFNKDQLVYVYYQEDNYYYYVMVAGTGLKGYMAAKYIQTEETVPKKDS